MLQKMISIFFFLAICATAQSKQLAFTSFECKPTELTDINRFESVGQVLDFSKDSFQGLLTLNITNSGPTGQTEEIASHLLRGKVTFFPAGSLYIQDTWLLQGSYQLNGRDFKLSLLIDAKNATSSTVEVDGRVFYSQCLRTF